MIKKLNIIGLFLITGGLLFSCSPFEEITGDKELSYLAGEETLDIKFTYEDIKVGDMDEEAYVQEKVKEKNEKEAGSGDEWKKKWYGQRNSKLEPAFENRLNDYLEEKNLYAGRDQEDANYQIIIAVTKMEPGFYGGPVNDPGYLSADIKFVEKGKPDQALTKMKMKEASAGDADGLYSVAQRLKSSYRAAAIHLGRFIRDKSF